MPLGSPVVPLENTRYANVSRFAGLVGAIGKRRSRASLMKSARLFLPLTRPWSTNIRSSGIPTSRAAWRATAYRSGPTNRHVALDVRRVLPSSYAVA